ncbi:hypothetical protein [Streptomyces huasconensis]|uniref:hypothetical protein n=1 Tax=Streptomyces huasconensis TaxID=1854574 RepID=UPI0033C7E556
MIRKLAAAVLVATPLLLAGAPSAHAGAGHVECNAGRGFTMTLDEESANGETVGEGWNCLLPDGSDMLPEGTTGAGTVRDEQCEKWQLDVLGNPTDYCLEHSRPVFAYEKAVTNDEGRTRFYGLRQIS